MRPPARAPAAKPELPGRSPACYLGRVGERETDLPATARDILRIWVAIVAAWALVVQAVVPATAAPLPSDLRAICAAAMAGTAPAGEAPGGAAHDDCCTFSLPPTALPPDGPPRPVAAAHRWIRLDAPFAPAGVRGAETPETAPLVPRGPPEAA